jgi:hypothetical protein
VPTYEIESERGSTETSRWFGGRAAAPPPRHSMQVGRLLRSRAGSQFTIIICKKRRQSLIGPSSGGNCQASAPVSTVQSVKEQAGRTSNA